MNYNHVTKSDEARVLVQEKNMCWIFVQNPMQMDLVYLCPGHKTSRNRSKPIKWCAFLFNVKIVYTYLPHLIHLARDQVPFCFELQSFFKQFLKPYLT